MGFIGNGAYVATVESRGIARLRDPAEREDVPAVGGVAPMRADVKLEQTVQDQAVGEWAVEADGALRLRGTVWSDASLDAAMAVMEQIAEDVLEVHPEFDAFVVWVAPEGVRTIAELHDEQALVLQAKEGLRDVEGGARGGGAGSGGRRCWRRPGAERAPGGSRRHVRSGGGKHGMGEP